MARHARGGNSANRAHRKQLAAGRKVNKKRKLSVKGKGALKAKRAALKKTK